MQSGLPFSVASGADNARSGTGGQLAERTADPILSGSRSRTEKVAQWFNTAAFTPNALGTFGNSGRNSMRGPGHRSLDFGLHKTFNAQGRVKAQVRVEAFNALNNVNLNLPNSSRNSGNFGKILSANDPRIMQLAVRFSF